MQEARRLLHLCSVLLERAAVLRPDHASEDAEVSTRCRSSCDSFSRVIRVNRLRGVDQEDSFFPADGPFRALRVDVRAASDVAEGVVFGVPREDARRGELDAFVCDDPDSAPEPGLGGVVCSERVEFERGDCRVSLSVVCGWDNGNSCGDNRFWCTFGGGELGVRNLNRPDDSVDDAALTLHVVAEGGADFAPDSLRLFHGNVDVGDDGDDDDVWGSVRVDREVTDVDG